MQQAHLAEQSAEAAKPDAGEVHPVRARLLVDRLGAMLLRYVVGLYDEWYQRGAPMRPEALLLPAL